MHPLKKLIMKLKRTMFKIVKAKILMMMACRKKTGQIWWPRKIIPPAHYMWEGIVIFLSRNFPHFFDILKTS